MIYNKPKLYTERPLKGAWDVTLKLDGVRAIWTTEGALSRAGKPLYNLPSMPVGFDAEVFKDSWETSVSMVRTQTGVETAPKSCLYSLDPLDKRLFLGTMVNPDKEFVQEKLNKYVGLGYEGLVLRQGDKWIKVKPHETTDLKVIELIEGKGKHTGRLGKVVTNLGSVGTGFSDEQRERFWTPEFIGTTIEVKYMSLTPQGKMRHPVFLRERFDKSIV